MIHLKQKWAPSQVTGEKIKRLRPWEKTLASQATGNCDISHRTMTLTKLETTQMASDETKGEGLCSLCVLNISSHCSSVLS